jgi:glycine betaine/choline ABC-type transport system substrate-binding protein
MRTHLSGRLVTAALAAIASLLLLAACGSSDKKSSSSSSGSSSTSSSTSSGTQIQPNPADKGKTITIGSKNFPESIIIGRIYGQALAKAGYTVKYDLNLGLEEIATKAVKSGQIDGYPEYTGTALTALLGVQPSAVPKDENAAYQEAKKLYASKLGFTALPQTPFTDANAVGMTAATAKKLGNPKKISDLKGKAQNLTIAASAECFKRTDCVLGLQKIYGIKFKKEIPIDVSQRHAVILKGKADITIPFTTDGEIVANKEVVLDDDKNLFPPYNVTFVMKNSTAKRLGPDLVKVITTVQKGLTTPVMTELNSRVQIDKQDAAKVAGDYLRESGYVK